MAANLRPLKTAMNLPPTTRILPSAVPLALMLNLRASAPASLGHDSHQRSEHPQKWASSSYLSPSAGLIQKSFTTCKTIIYTLSFFNFTPNNHVYSSSHVIQPVSSFPFFHYLKQPHSCTGFLSIPCLIRLRKQSAELFHGRFNGCHQRFSR
jgi:hypothetical protein